MATTWIIKSVDLSSDTTFDAAGIAAIDTALTAAAGQSGAAFIIADNDTDTILLYDPDTANTGDIVKIITITGLGTGASANLFSGGEIDIL